MAIAHKEVAPQLLTYEQYLAEGEVNKRYDIIDGVRLMTSPTEQHQDELLNIAEQFRAYQRRSRRGKVIIAPRDILIRYQPLNTRQPDVMFISTERRAQSPPANDPAPLDPAPELVVEIVSPSDTPRVLQEKIADYCSVGVLECWVVRRDLQTVEVLRLTPQGAEPIATYGREETVRSLTFPDLTVPVAAIFAE